MMGFLGFLFHVPIGPGELNVASHHALQSIRLSPSAGRCERRSEKRLPLNRAFFTSTTHASNCTASMHHHGTTTKSPACCRCFPLASVAQRRGSGIRPPCTGPSRGGAQEHERQREEKINKPRKKEREIRRHGEGRPS